ncbi:hypothetical protein [Pseudozobellia thermophila]|uniref:Uncharacterized protein n=1 Tax=Pseudozobellia thermophila TaxID=192903 RepID=A0A1M6M6B2_9FLAO|nr:hypothetical protein [Pseudozobellia thermophila]SHJ79014.1 hypothetical protein SAMN04488513_1098 [Pseudozobellia thermophila]
MSESQTISKQLPALKSMQYETLRELGIRHIQELAGKLWTDYNTHDPGVTILEALGYVLTDIGYRIDYDIKDILAQKLGDPSYYDIKNFYTAKEILPVCPVTFNDFREVMIDVEVVDESGEEPQYYGVRNAWIAKSPDAEHKIYVDRKRSELRLSPVPGLTKQEGFYVKTLYDVLLEFDKNTTYGDLNENSIAGNFVLYEFQDLKVLQGLKIAAVITFPSWDDPIDWSDYDAVRNGVGSVDLKVLEIADGYGLNYQVANDKRVVLSLAPNSKPIPHLEDLTAALNAFLYDPNEGLIVKYIEKIGIVHQVVGEVKAKLHQNRNLCDDFFRVNALKVEEILVCADIELDNQADVEETEAALFYAISNFLSPTVYFYTLEEMMDKCGLKNTYTVQAIDKGEKKVTVGSPLKEDVGSEDTVSISGDDGIAGEYTVSCIRKNELNPDFTDIYVMEEIKADTFAEGTLLFVGRMDENLCRTVDEIFEGPRLKHGFIDEKELEAAQLTKVIRVSDLIRIIMDVPGVKSVRHIQIANKPRDNDDAIPERSVKWCLELAWEHNYVPRLSRDKSKITYYKDQLPFLANDGEVISLLNELEEAERPQKIRYPKMDIDPPVGEFKDLENYVSIQEEFPDIYGVGTSGIPDLSSLDGLKKAERQGKVKQLKGFLTFFDQLIANELAQLNGVKDLFSMNGEKNEFGEYNIDRTYFSKPLYDVIPNGVPLYRDRAGHLASLEKIVESEKVYIERRNKFLDHLLGRFAETFTDYALLAHKIDKQNAGADLIEDKLQFLDRYPAISAERGKALDYRQWCCPWHVDNVSGVEQRTSFLLGIAEKEIQGLNFGPNFSIDTAAMGFTIAADDATPLLRHNGNLETEVAVKELLEQLVQVGLYRSNYTIVVGEDGKFSFQLGCDGQVLALSAKNDFTSDTDGGDADTAIGQVIEILKKEHLDNPESNRKNLACPYKNYFTYSLTADVSPAMPDLPTYSFSYSLYSEAFNFTEDHKIIEGTITEEVVLEETENPPLTEAQVLKKGEARIGKLLWEIVSSAGDRRNYNLDAEQSPYRFALRNKKGEVLGQSTGTDFNALLADQIKNSEGSTLQIRNSGANDGEYTISDAQAKGPYIEIELTGAPPSAILDGEAMWEERFGIQEINIAERYLKASSDIGAHFLEGDTFEIRNSSSNNGRYTIREISEEGGKTVLRLWEPVPTDKPDGVLIDGHAFQIMGVDGKTITVKGGEDEKAVQKLIDFVTDTFLAHEGMHLIEHTLLRPRINEDLFLPMAPKSLVPLEGSSARMVFHRYSQIVKVDAQADTVLVEDNIKTELSGDTILVEGGTYDGHSLKVVKVNTLSGKSRLKVGQDLKFDVPQAPFENGRIRYATQAEITKIKPTSNTLVTDDVRVKDMAEGDTIILINSEKEGNEGEYRVQGVKKVGDAYEVKLLSKLQRVQDRLLPIYLDQDCDTCQHSDVYSCIATVILPYWADRFVNINFRKYVERTIRLETPAHILLNVCWVDCGQMQHFEQAYKTWLMEINRPIWNKPELSKALNEFIEALTASRNIYPTGTLHSCDEEESLEGAIVLNNSVLGT